MGNYINEALLNASPYKKQQEEAKGLVSKWEKTGLLDGLNEDFKKNTMAVLLENQAKQLIGEASFTSPNAGNASTGDEEWSGVALPLVRRIFGELAAQEFVSVQPMNLPSGLVFYLDFKYGNSRLGFNKGDAIHGQTGKYSPSGSKSPYPKGGFYGTGRYGYTVSSGTLSDQTPASVATANMTDINFDGDVSASHGGALQKLTFTLTDAQMASADKLGVRAWHIYSGSGGDQVKWGEDGRTTSSTIPVGRVLPQFTSITGGELDGGTLTCIVSSSTTQTTSFKFQIGYIKSNKEASRGDFEDRVGDATQDSLKIPEVDLQLKSRAIVAKTRKLKAIWTPELAQDLNAYHSVDAEAELTSMLSEYISMEIDLEILDMLISDASTVDYWSLRQGDDYDSSTNTFVNNTFTGTRFEWWQTLVAKIQKVSNTIHQLTLRGGANFVVCGPKVSTVLESLPGYMTSTDGNKAQYAMGVQSVGSIQNRWTVYKNPYMQENTILVGFRGSNFLETGAVYAPYVPLIMTPLVYDPSDFTPRKGVMTRYAKKIIRPEFYAKVYVADLDLL